jgi:hypothetical protein
MHTTRLRSAAAVLAAVALPALLLTACSSSDDGSKAAPDSANQLHIVNGKAPLNTQQLSAALISSSDLPGWTVHPQPSTDSSGTSTLTADKPVCQPLADVTGTNPKIHRMAVIGASFAKTLKKGEKTPAVINQLLIASHAPGDAAKVMASVKKGVAECTSFTVTDSTGTKTPFTIKKGPAVSVGDASVSWIMNDPSDKKKGAALITVVQTGDTVTNYVSVKSSGGPGPVPLEVARKQDAKLKVVLASRK